MLKLTSTNPLHRAIVPVILWGISLFLLAIFENLSLISAVSFLFIFLVLYLGYEILWALIKNGNYFVITGLLFLLFSIVTFVAGLWDNDYINQAGIVTIATVALFFTFIDFLEVSGFSKNAQHVWKILFFIGLIIFNFIVLMITKPVIVEWVSNLNTDYLTAVALGLALTNIGLRQLKNKTDG